MERVYITDTNKIERVVSTSIEEQEIVISKSRDINYYSVFISDNTMLTKFKRLMNSAPDGYVKCWEGSRNSEGQMTGYFFEINPRCIAFRAGRKRTRTLTEEQKAAYKTRFVERTRKAREAKKKVD